MSKNTISLLALILMLIVIALIWLPQAPVQERSTSPVNGLTGGTPPPEPAASNPQNKAMDSDDVPAGAEVSGEASKAPTAPAPAAPPADAKGMALPPSEGQ